MSSPALLLFSPCLHDHHLLLPQFEEAVVSLLLQFVTKGLVATTLRNCTQLLEMLQVLGVDTGKVVEMARLEVEEERKMVEVK